MQNCDAICSGLSNQINRVLVHYTDIEMDSSSRIRTAIAEVFELRGVAQADTSLGIFLTEVKSLQARRFQAAYAPFLQSLYFGEPCRFFLEELYCERDFSERDAQFARIAKSLATIFPSSVVNTAVDIAELHALTERLDLQLATHWRQLEAHATSPTASGYIRAWRLVGQRDLRSMQLKTVLSLGDQLASLTRKPGLATLLKMMRRPAASAGLSSLQQFLEKGFTTFGNMARKENKSSEFLSHIQEQESAWIDSMYDEPLAKQSRTLDSLLNST